MLSYLLQLTLNGLITGAILALTGVGASLVFGIQRVANFAHGEYLTFAAYVALILNVVLRQSIVVAAVGAMAATAVLGGGTPLHGAAAAPGPWPGGAVAHHDRARAHAAERHLHRRGADDPDLRHRPVRGL